MRLAGCLSAQQLTIPFAGEGPPVTGETRHLCLQGARLPRFGGDATRSKIGDSNVAQVRAALLRIRSSQRMTNAMPPLIREPRPRFVAAPDRAQTLRSVDSYRPIGTEREEDSEWFVRDQRTIGDNNEASLKTGPMSSSSPALCLQDNAVKPDWRHLFIGDSCHECCDCGCCRWRPVKPRVRRRKLRIDREIANPRLPPPRRSWSGRQLDNADCA